MTLASPLSPEALSRLPLPQKIEALALLERRAELVRQREAEESREAERRRLERDFFAIRERCESLGEILKLPGGEDKVRSLLQMNLDAKSSLRALVLDAKNKYDRKAVSFGSLPDLMDRFDQHAAGAADIPMTRFMGMSPGGMNSTGESDLRNYYDRVSAGQTLEMGPAMMRLDEALIRSATGVRNPAIHYEWNPLWQLGEKDKADIFKTKADAARTLAGTGGTSEPIIPLEALSDALVNELVEDGALAGLEGAIDEYGKLSEQENADDDEAAALGDPNRPVPTES